MLGAGLNWKVLHDVFYKKTSPTSRIIVSLVPVFAVYTVCYPTVRDGGGVAQKLQHGGCGHIVYKHFSPTTDNVSSPQEKEEFHLGH